jgi:hypothetical protein
MAASTSDRLDALLRSLDEHADPAVRDRMREAVSLLMELHRAALDRVLTLAADPALGGPPLVSRLADDPVVGPLLLAHDVHPYDLEARLARALDRLRPRIASQGCRAAVTGVEDRVAHVRLDGGAHLSHRSPLVGDIEAGLLDAAPELSAVVIDTPNDIRPAATSPLIQILRSPPSPVGAGGER